MTQTGSTMPGLTGRQIRLHGQPAADRCWPATRRLYACLVGKVIAQAHRGRLPRAAAMLRAAGAERYPVAVSSPGGTSQVRSYSPHTARCRPQLPVPASRLLTHGALRAGRSAEKLSQDCGRPWRYGLVRVEVCTYLQSRISRFHSDNVREPTKVVNVTGPRRERFHREDVIR
jgi:hypothetical protein